MHNFSKVLKYHLFSRFINKETNTQGNSYFFVGQHVNYRNTKSEEKPERTLMIFEYH